jgi:hypothetical protein
VRRAGLELIRDGPPLSVGLAEDDAGPARQSTAPSRLK